MERSRLQTLVDAVPDYQAFLTVDELNANSKRLAERFPQAVELLPIGASRQGDPLVALKIGSGPRTALLFAMPHPNEPIGSMTLEYLSEMLAEAAIQGDTLGFTWYIVKCVDPDGARLNEGWIKGPFSLTNYARGYYRPPSHQQVEWTFPIDYKNLHFDAPLPETCALMELIEQIKPDLIYSLHNSGFGGVYLYLSKASPELYEPFYTLVESQGLPLHLGEPEVPNAVELSKAIFKMLTLPEMYDFYEANMGGDPSAMMKQGASSFEYAQRFCNPYFLVCEMPYFYNPAINDTSPSDVVRREAVLQNIANERAGVDALSALYSRIKPFITVPTPFEDNLKTALEFYPAMLAAQENWAQNEPKLDTLATVAEKFDNQFVSRFYMLLQMGMVVRLIEAQSASGSPVPELSAALQDAKTLFDRSAADLEASLEYQVIPIQKLVRVQLGAVLLATEQLK